MCIIRMLAFFHFDLLLFYYYSVLAFLWVSLALLNYLGENFKLIVFYQQHKVFLVLLSKEINKLSRYTGYIFILFTV